MKLDRDAAVAGVQRLADELGLPLLEAAEGIVTIANANMAGAIRSRTVQKGPRPPRVRARRLRRRRPDAGGRGRRVARHPRGDRAAVPGHHVRRWACSTSDLKYDQMRTVFMTEGAIDDERLDHDLAELAAEELRGRLREDGVADDEIEVAAGLDCRYVGQGYELRIPLPEERLRRRRSGVPPAARAGVRPRVPRPDRDRQPARDGVRQSARGSSTCRRAANGGDAPLLGEGESVFGREAFDVDHARVTTSARSCRSARSIDGAAVVFQRDATTVVPPGWTARADASGSLILK